MRPSPAMLSPFRRAILTRAPRTSFKTTHAITLAVAGVAGLSLAYVTSPFERRVALDVRSAWEDRQPESSSSAGPSEDSQDEGNSAAFDPVTGEINWDCSCLGGMAHGPCGPEFREAFSCFVYSNEEPKGVECVEKFKGMQDCFRRHPDVYGEEINDDEDEPVEGEAPVAAVAKEAGVDTPETPFPESPSQPTAASPSSSS